MAMEDWLIPMMMMMMMMMMMTMTMTMMVMVRRTQRRPLVIDPRRGDSIDPCRQIDKQTQTHSIA